MTPEQTWDWIVSRARAMGATRGQIQKWKERGRVSNAWKWALSEHAHETRARIDRDILDNIPPGNGKAKS